VESFGTAGIGDLSGEKGSTTKVALEQVESLSS
jgi:hypothetical protein